MTNLLLDVYQNSPALVVVVWFGSVSGFLVTCKYLIHGKEA